jgi:ribonuclease D
VPGAAFGRRRGRPSGAVRPVVLRGAAAESLLEDRNIVKIFHYARFDVALLKAYLGADVGPVFCTKVASKLVRTYTDRHGLKDLVRDMLGIDLSKQQQSSDWGAPVLSDAQSSMPPRTWSICTSSRAGSSRC